jgi:branched-chain amino acid transport system ATP-binding protein
MLRVEGVDVGYGDTQVLWDVGLEVGDGEVVALRGSNGAGKSTLLATISGLLRPWAGRIWYAGQDIGGLPPEKLVGRGLVQVPQGRRLFPGLTVEQNLRLGAYRRRDARETAPDFARVVALFPVLRERLHQPAGSLSGGEQQMCAIGRALMARPRLLLIDELSLGLAPAVVEGLWPALREVNAAGTSILLVEQDVQLALENSRRGYVLDTGRIVLSGPSADLLADPRIVSAYLGV